MSARPRLLALPLLLPVAVGCGTDGDLASAMEAVCDAGTVEPTEDPVPGEADVVREATCTADDGEGRAAAPSHMSDTSSTSWDLELWARCPEGETDVMISPVTHAHLVARRHVDLGRTRSSICPTS